MVSLRYSKKKKPSPQFYRSTEYTPILVKSKYNYRERLLYSIYHMHFTVYNFHYYCSPIYLAEYGSRVSKMSAVAFTVSANNVAYTHAATQPGAHFNRKSSYIHIAFLVSGFIDLFHCYWIAFIP